MSDHTPPAPAAGHAGTALSILCAPDLAPLFWRPARIGIGSAWWGHVPFAHWLVAAIRPRTIVELGTHHGVSYAAFCEAVMRHGLDTRCSAIDTWKGDAHAGLYDDSVLAELRSFHDARYGAFSSLIQSSFDEALDYFGDGTVDLLHIDGLHTYKAVENDFTSWLPKLSSRAVVLFHDINVRENAFGVWQFWEEQCRRYPHFAFIHAYGLGVLAVGDAPPVEIQALCSITNPQYASAIRERFALIGERWNLEYRDEIRLAEIARMSAERAALDETLRGKTTRADTLTEQLAGAQEELSMLRPHLVDLEHARATLDDALRGQTTRADILTEQLAGAQQELGVLHAHLADLEHARAALDEELREQIARADALTEQLTVSRWKPRTVAARHVTVRPTTTSDAEGSQPLPDSSEGIRKMRRVCLFSFYDAQGIVDDYVVFFSRN